MEEMKNRGMTQIEMIAWKSDAKARMEAKLKTTLFQQSATTPEFMAGWFLEEAAQAKLMLKVGCEGVKMVAESLPPEDHDVEENLLTIADQMFLAAEA